ncbi:hypothetical protein ACN47E_002689 [Coniothyrium glycines]
MPLKVLIVGAGVCGPAIALFLQRSNPKHSITVIERSPALRTGGQQIDLKEQGIPIMEKTGLLERIRELCVNEGGMEIVDKSGSTIMRFGITPAGGKSNQAFELTNEFEFMRGDMVRLFYDTTLSERNSIVSQGEREGSLSYEFNKTITTLDQSSPHSVTVTFSDNTTSTYDLVIAADGQSSRTRRLAFGQETSTSSFKSLNIHAAYYNIPRLATESSLARVYFAPGNRMVVTRTGDRPLTQIYFFLMRDQARSAHMRDVLSQPIAQQKDAWTQQYRDAGWECPRFLENLHAVDDFYACEIAQVKMPQGVLHKGRVVLLGDAGYCPSAFTGMGTTLALIGAYVLAGELEKNSANVDAALDAYTQTMQQPIQECQKLAFGVGGGLFPSSELGIRAVNGLLWGMSCLRVDRLLKWIAGFLPEEKGRWEIPEYEGFGLEGRKGA